MATSETELNELEISNLPNKTFKVMIIKMLTKLGRRMDEHSENLNSTITEMKKTLKRINSGLNEMEEQDQPTGRQSM